MHASSEVYGQKPSAIVVPLRDVSPRDIPLRKSPLHDHPMGDLSRVEARATAPKEIGTIRTFSRDQEIFGEGDDAASVFTVVKGVVRTFKVLSDGRRQIDAFHLPGDVFGLEPGSDYGCSAEAVSDVTVRIIRRHLVGKLVESDPALAGQLVEVTALALNRARNHILLLGRKSAREKIASFLLGLAKRLSDKPSLDLPMSRADIADHLGLTIETVSRTLTQFQRQGLIELPTTRRVIRLRDVEALDQLEAGEGDEFGHGLTSIGMTPVRLLA